MTMSSFDDIETCLCLGFPLLPYFKKLWPWIKSTERDITFATCKLINAWLWSILHSNRFGTIEAFGTQTPYLYSDQLIIIIHFIQSAFNSNFSFTILSYIFSRKSSVTDGCFLHTLIVFWTKSCFFNFRCLGIFSAWASVWSIIAEYARK